ncbi:unnamed protein product [Scytosiphon promiscuus]
MAVIKKPRNEAEKNQVLGLLHLQSTPRKAEVVTWGYDLGTASGRRDNCATVLLSLLLVVIAITVSGLTSSMRLIYVQADLCETRDSTLSANLILMRNITNYYGAKEASSLAVNITAAAYYQAQETYNSLGLSYSWPSPYDLSEEERQELESDAREGGDDCETVEECVGGAIGFIGGIVGQDTCAEVEVPCPDIDSTALLVEYDASQKSLDLFGNNVTDYDAEYTASVAESALDQATNAITVLVRRINFASSIYVLYLAFLVIVTPPFIVYGAKWNQRIFDFLANVNKPLWITLIVLVWYGHEFFQSVINSSLYQVIWANFLQDPCWADPDFLVNTSVVISDTCTDITSAHNLFNQAGANYRYYDQVEATWQAVASESGGPYYGDPDVDFPQDFPGNCSSTALLAAIQPGDGEVNWWSLFFHSGALVALLLQLVLAHWFVSWFSVLRPLTMHRGRVMIPESSQGDAALYREVRSFARRRAILPFVFTTAFLLFLLVNLGESSSDEGMGRKVLIGGFALAFLQFVLIPLLIWRPADERMTPLSAKQMSTVHASESDDDEEVRGSRVLRYNISYEADGREVWESGSIVESPGSPSPSPRDHRSYPRNGLPNVDVSSGDSEPDERGMGRSDSSESLSSVLQAAMAASAAAAAVGEGRHVPRY